MKVPYRLLRIGDRIEFSCKSGDLRFDVVYMNGETVESRNHRYIGLFEHYAPHEVATIVADTHNLDVREERTLDGAIFHFIAPRS